MILRASFSVVILVSTISFHLAIAVPLLNSRLCGLPAVNDLHGSYDVHTSSLDPGQTLSTNASVDIFSPASFVTMVGAVVSSPSTTSLGVGITIKPSTSSVMGVTSATTTRNDVTNIYTPSSTYTGGATYSTASVSFTSNTSASTCEPMDVNPYTGDVTHYDGGLGACNWTVDTSVEMVVALPALFMGSQSNDNPYCRRSITIRNPSSCHTAVGIVGDKCMGCVARDIDLTDALFGAVASGCDGRCSGFEWWFND